MVEAVEGAGDCGAPITAPFADTARGAGATVRLLRVAPVPNNVVNGAGRVIAYADQEMRRIEVEWLRQIGPMVAKLVIGA